jgi:hypothetical protein
MYIPIIVREINVRQKDRKLAVSKVVKICNFMFFLAKIIRKNFFFRCKEKSSNYQTMRNTFLLCFLFVVLRCKKIKIIIINIILLGSKIIFYGKKK